MRPETKLFPEPFDLDDVEKTLGDDNFFSLAMLFMGFEHNWRIALLQTAELMSMFEQENRDHHPIYRMAGALIHRAETFDDTGKLLDEITTALGLLPGTSFMEEIKMAHLHKIDPQAWQRKKNKLWLENYKTQMGALHGPPVPNGDRGSAA